jgi:hypothetical protein
MRDHPFVTVICGHCGHLLQVPSYCGNRFCQVCGRLRSGRLRRRISQVTGKIALRKYDSIKLVTLTIPRSSGLADTVRDLQVAFRRLRQRAFWKKYVRGGAYFIEFKHSDKGWNPHLHILLESAYIPVKELSKHWASVSPGRIVDIRKIPLGAAVGYVTKYCSKLDLSEDLQFEASDALKGKRLFTLFGKWARIPVVDNFQYIVCKNCGVSAWFFNPYGSIDQWVQRSTSDPPYLYPPDKTEKPVIIQPRLAV